MASVYFLKLNGFDCIKIGHTSENNPIKRINHYKTYAPFGINVLGFVVISNLKDAVNLEKEMQICFLDKNQNREWYNITIDEIDIYLNSLGFFRINHISERKINNKKELYKKLYLEDKKKVVDIAKEQKVSIQYAYRVLKNVEKIKTSNLKSKIIELKKTTCAKDISKLLNVSVQYVYRIK